MNKKVRLIPRHLSTESNTAKYFVSFEIQRAIVSIRTLNEIYPMISSEEKEQIKRVLKEIKIG